MWSSIPCCRKELSLSVTLSCGQSFRWKEVEPGVWRSVLAGRIWTLKQTDNELLYHVQKSDSDCESSKEEHTVAKKSKRPKRLIPKGSGDSGSGDSVNENSGLEDTLKDYFQLDVSLGDLYKRWSAADKNFADRGRFLPGVRVLRQDPVENLFSFICSSNNNITRISGMVEKLCVKYGLLVGRLDGESWHSFPAVSALAGKDTEGELRCMGFGYRAKFIHQAAALLLEQGEDWLHQLRNIPYPEAHAELQKLPGVGAKVADCVCLFSLDHPGAIPVDTHVWQIACRDYMPELKAKKHLTDRTYKDIGEFFRNLFGGYAGWAHSVLFSADLKKFRALTASPAGDDVVSPTKKRKRKIEEKP